MGNLKMGGNTCGFRAKVKTFALFLIIVSFFLGGMFFSFYFCGVKNN